MAWRADLTNLCVQTNPYLFDQPDAPYYQCALALGEEHNVGGQPAAKDPPLRDLEAISLVQKGLPGGKKPPNPGKKVTVKEPKLTKAKPSPRKPTATSSKKTAHYALSTRSCSTGRPLAEEWLQKAAGQGQRLCKMVCPALDGFRSQLDRELTGKLVQKLRLRHALILGKVLDQSGAKPRPTGDTGISDVEFVAALVDAKLGFVDDLYARASVVGQRPARWPRDHQSLLNVVPELRQIWEWSQAILHAPDALPNEPEEVNATAAACDAPLSSPCPCRIARIRLMPSSPAPALDFDGDLDVNSTQDEAEESGLMHIMTVN